MCFYSVILCILRFVRVCRPVAGECVEGPKVAARRGRRVARLANGPVGMGPVISDLAGVSARTLGAVWRLRIVCAVSL